MNPTASLGEGLYPGRKKPGRTRRPGNLPTPHPKISAALTSLALPALIKAVGRRDAGLVDAMVHRRRRADVAGEAVVDLLRHRVGGLCVLEGLRRDLAHARVDRSDDRDHRVAGWSANTGAVVGDVRLRIVCFKVRNGIRRTVERPVRCRSYQRQRARYVYSECSDLGSA